MSGAYLNPCQEEHFLKRPNIPCLQVTYQVDHDSVILSQVQDV